MITTIKKLIVEYLNDHGPTLGTKLVVETSHYILINPSFGKLFEEIDIPNIIEDLVKKQKIAEIEYTLKNSDYRVRSIYFPIKTKFRIINGETYE